MVVQSSQSPIRASDFKVNREYDLFEKLPDGAPVWRQHVVGLLNARETLKAIASSTLNECFAIHLPSKDIVARLNVKEGEELVFPLP